MYSMLPRSIQERESQKYTLYIHDIIHNKEASKSPEYNDRAPNISAHKLCHTPVEKVYSLQAEASPPLVPMPGRVIMAHIPRYFALNHRTASPQRKEMALKDPMETLSWSKVKPPGKQVAAKCGLLGYSLLGVHRAQE